MLLPKIVGKTKLALSSVFFIAISKFRMLQNHFMQKFMNATVYFIIIQYFIGSKNNLVWLVAQKLLLKYNSNFLRDFGYF